jgi:hypothetical protein
MDSLAVVREALCRDIIDKKYENDSKEVRRLLRKASLEAFTSAYRDTEIEAKALQHRLLYIIGALLGLSGLIGLYIPVRKRNIHNKNIPKNP